jgi:multiple sugar transport system permease protein
VLLYYHGFTFFQMGYASAMAVLLLLVAFVFTFLIIRNSRRWVHYGGAVR